MRYRLRTLLILLAILPPLLWFGWTKYEAWRVEQERQRAIRATSQQQSQLQTIDEPINGTTSDLGPNPARRRRLQPPSTRAEFPLNDSGRGIVLKQFGDLKLDPQRAAN